MIYSSGRFLPEEPRAAQKIQPAATTCSPNETRGPDLAAGPRMMIRRLEMAYAAFPISFPRSTAADRPLMTVRAAGWLRRVALSPATWATPGPSRDPGRADEREQYRMQAVALARFGQTGKSHMTMQRYLWISNEVP